MPNKTYRFALIAILMFSATLGCSLFNQISQGVGKLSTGVREGRDLIGTARAITTDVGGSGLIQTAQSLATTAGENGLLKTAVAFATQQGPELKETVQAFVTQEGPGLKETIQAAGTQGRADLGETPTDIPLMSGQKVDFIGTKQLVSYSIAAKSTDVVDFYNKEMVTNGWEKVNEENVNGTNLVVLTYQKPDRTASITVGTVPTSDKTTVLIAILPR